ncbi:MAG: mannose-1-phosphate guanyltransferase [Armatimonadetes bacterium]|jgi:mannose-1-phosphate guanylyltransferase|nr:mannose-1-phosphate guanyltransferase [Armatimonadota bacterium]HOC31633.1 sugar phosphate nucleotidyltransferase [Armatimonadota bacterium]
MVAVFMAGGSGTRLWPLSRENNPKQLHALVGEQSLMAQTVSRVLPCIDPGDIWIVTSEKYADRIAEHAPSVPRNHIIAEPYPLGTNLAVGLGAIHVAKRDPDAVMFVGWADSYIANDVEFRRVLQIAERAAPDVDGIIIGVEPTYPATGYGYIEMGDPLPNHSEVHQIVRFEEKPGEEKARHFQESGRYLWNPGISVWKASRLLYLIQKYKPDHYSALVQVSRAIGTPHEAEVMREAFQGLDREAIDTAIFEHADNLATVPVDLGWSDVGSWSALHEVLSPEGGNVIRGPVIAVETNNTLIFGSERLIGTLGVSDLVIVDAGDAILVAHRDYAERLKELHSAIKEAGRMEFL